MIDQPSAPALTPGGTPDPEIILTDLRWPFAELGAQGVPPTLPVAKGPVQLSLAMLAAMREGVPQLVQYDEAGRALTTGDRVKGPSFDVPPGTTLNTPISIPVGTESLAVYLQDGDAGANGSTLTIQGQSAGWPYYPVAGWSQIMTAVQVQIDLAQDPLVNFILQNKNPVNHIFVATTLVKAVDELTILSNPGQEPNVRLLGGPFGQGGFPRSAPFNVALAPGATLDLVPAVPGQTIRAVQLGLAVVTVGNAQVILEDDAGVQVAEINPSQVIGYDKSLWGVAFTPGHKARLHNIAGAGTPGMAGELIFTQG